MTLKLEINGFPTCWGDVTVKQMKYIRRCTVEMVESISAGTDQAKAFNTLRLKLFLSFAGMKVLKRPPVMENGERFYFFRRKGFLHLFESFPLSSQRLTGMIADNLGWVDYDTLVSIADLSPQEAITAVNK